MAILWAQCLSPWTDPNGAPYSGAKAYFFEAGTTTPRTVYRDSDLGESHDHPVVANASGMFPAVFMPTGDCRLRITDAVGVTIWDVDGISTPAIGDSGGGGGGDTPVELLARTGDYKFRHGTGSHSGWVRAAGRTIGNASSGAAERANADCEALFLYLWGADSTLVVSGGRGANAASDWAAAKTIALPDMRLRGLIGMASMGSTASTIIGAGLFDGGENGDVLGATVGAGSVNLSISQLPVHTHTASFSGTAVPPHTHSFGVAYEGSGVGSNGGYALPSGTGGTTTSAGGHTPAGTVSVENAGSGEAHTNVQPSAVATCYLKL